MRPVTSTGAASRDVSRDGTLRRIQWGTAWNEPRKQLKKIGTGTEELTHFQCGSKSHSIRSIWFRTNLYLFLQESKQTSESVFDISRFSGATRRVTTASPWQPRCKTRCRTHRSSAVTFGALDSRGLRVASLRTLRPHAAHARCLQRGNPQRPDGAAAGSAGPAHPQRSCLKHRALELGGM